MTEPTPINGEADRDTALLTLAENLKRASEELKRIVADEREKRLRRAHG